MVEWHDIIWQSLLQELQKLGRQYPTKPYTIKHNDGFVSIIRNGHTYMFNMGDYAGDTSKEITQNMAKDIVENYLV